MPYDSTGYSIRGSISNLAYLKAEVLLNGGGLPLGYKLNGRLQFSHPERPILILGPSRSGKSSSIIIPSILSNFGPTVSLSTKTDLMQTTAKAKGLVGNVWCYDPSDSLSISELESLNVKKVKWSPLDAISDWESALRVTNLIVGSSMAAGDINANHWNERAETLIGPLMYAAHLSNRTIKDVVVSILTRDLSWITDTLDQFDSDSMAKYVLASIMTTEDRELSGIFSTAASMLTVYKSSKTLDNSLNSNFSPAKFVKSTDTLFICSSGSEQIRTAPLIVTMLDSIRSRAYEKYAHMVTNLEHEVFSSRRTLFALDELGQSAKMPFLPGMIAEGGGQGITTLACFQDLSQAVAKYGPIADGFLTLFPTKVIFNGISDKKTVEAISLLAGEHEIERFSYSYDTRSITLSEKLAFKMFNMKPKSPMKQITKSTQTLKTLPPDKVSAGRLNSVLLVDSAMPPTFLGQNRYFNQEKYLKILDTTNKSEISL